MIGNTIYFNNDKVALEINVRSIVNFRVDRRNFGRNNIVFWKLRDIFFGTARNYEENQKRKPKKVKIVFHEE
jgi:hypothetical protein